MIKRDLINRDSGILSKKQREFLAGELDVESEYENPQKQINLFRYRIRNKVEQALFDFVLLNWYLDKEDWEKIYEEVDGKFKDYRAEANNTGEVPQIENHEPSETLFATRCAFQFLLNALANVAGMTGAINELEYAIKTTIQDERAGRLDEFYYGSIDTYIDDLEDNSMALDVVAEWLENAHEEAAENIPNADDTELLIETLVEFEKKLPEIPAHDFPRIIDKLYATGHLSEKEYDWLRPVTVAIMRDVKRPQIAEAIEAE